MASKNPNMLKKNRVAVVGAGISGLCAAYWLKKEGFEVQVFEKAGQAGGAIISERSDGFLIDMGPNSALETSETLRDLVQELGLEDVKLYGNEASQKRYVLRNGTLLPVPTSPMAFLATSLFSWKAKLRLLKEPFVKPTSGNDISLADFVRHRLGQEFLDYAINPFVAGVYAGDPKTLSTASGFPKLYALEKNYGSLIKGAIGGARERKKRKEVAKDRARMFSFKNGMQTFTDALAEKIGDSLQLNASVTRLERRSSGFEIVVERGGRPETLAFDLVLLCVPTHVLAVLLGPENPALLSDVYYPPVSVVYMGFREESVKREMDGFGFLVPEVEKRNILGSLWSSTIFPGRAPAGHVSFTTFVGGTRQPEKALLPDALLEELVQEELKDIVGIDGDPVFVRIRKWERAIPQYRMGYQKVQALLDDLESRFHGLYFAGNYRRGISVGDSVLSAFETTEKIKQW